ncbi:MAG: tetratricopeptide repeat protein [Halieaceae bacterium]|jgi:tetratricopeptide (TPR) repeat protein|nr:tetratricopeptide repeat protein [Halieaceae bacterium]
MLRLLPTGLACALLLGCASPAPVKTADTPVKPESDSAAPAAKAPERAFPDDSIYPLLLAEFALRRRAYDVALEQYLAQAPRLRDPGVSAHTTHLAQFMGREDAALESVQLWIELEPDNIEANNTLSILLIRQGRAVEALPHMALLADKGEEVNFPALLRGFEELPPDQREALVQGINDLAGEYPDNTQLLLTQAMVLAEQEQFDAALDTLRRLFELEPNQSQAAMLEARILLAQQSPAPYARLERVLEENPQDTQIRLQYARLLTATDMEAARKQFELLSAQSPRDGELLLSLALISREIGDDEAAKAYLRQLLALEQHVDEAHYYLGRIAEDADDPSGALYEYRQVEEGRELLVAASRASVILIDQGRIDEMRAWFTELRRQNPEQAEQLFGVEADLLARGDELTSAIDVLEEALGQLPESSSLRYARAMIAEQQGNLALMETELRKIIASEPDNATAINALGYTLANRTRRYDEAYELIARALALEPDEPAILDSMGWVLYRQGKYEEALDYLTRAYAAFPDPEVAAHLGEVLWVSGDTDNALKVWQGGLTKDPDNAVLAETLERLEVSTAELDLSGSPERDGETPEPAP